ncbi:NADPH-cytochrome-P450 oxidoreductase [Heterostelium album PN500]|uniref:NADPH--cytochrome P450 reductase n=1 Tax=Heterostelium pallidum (strain ATCC 26659 / Pp 5 / PN500) TaxID=670386 RepID=D3B528_HETP5|nr:NADPH-cytochrome-P450 oxidoreductase [Heterostelium album PN500]EFA83496.1 NADPH-cytochrome-P450 oxidoreductase [Heterostelium album PN500]|eukprot:XP_020435613.1 NADPH-cytochrome-P450 oxidoreductase [Heterostelium album PN500]
MLDLIESLLIEYAPTIIVVVLIVGTYLYMNRPPPPPPINRKIKTPAAPKPPKVQKSSSEKVLKIFFGTQTRTAEDFSRVIEKEAKKIGIPCEVVDLETYDPNDLSSEYFAMFLVATHGEGDPTDNAKEFYLWLTSEDRPSTLLANPAVPFTVFGLGNKTYEHYNAVARVFDRRLEELGGKRVFERGEGDDDATLEEDFLHWKKNMWVTVCEYLGYELKSSEDDKFTPRFRMITLTEENYDVNNSYIRVNPPKIKPKLSNNGSVIYDIKNPYLATVVENKELHSSESDRSCKHIEFDIGENLSYLVGDHLGIYPVNESALVEQLLLRLGVDGDTKFAMVPHDKAGSVIEASVGPMTVRKALSEVLDITNPPRKSILRTLAEYTQVEEEKKRLIRLASEEAADEYNEFIKHDFRTIGELLQNFPGINPPISHFLEFMPRLPARYYSISSSLNATPGRVTITSVVVNFNTPTGRFHNGVCSTWLANLKVGDKVPMFVRESHFRLPSHYTSAVASDKPAPPMIMVGPGTGFAPFRGFLQEIQHRLSTKQISEQFDNILYFGCRGSNIDYLYKEEMVVYQQSSSLKTLTVAFSRETAEKTYVQHKMASDKEKIWSLISNGGYFYVCGDARSMAKSVNQTLIQIIKEYGSKDDNAAQQLIEDMQKSGRYLQDVWF